MSSILPNSLKGLIESLNSLPGIGPKSAERLAFYILQMNNTRVNNLVDQILEVKSRLKYCKECNNVSDDELCLICQDKGRDRKQLMIVEDVLDLMAFERMRGYLGLYHVLGGAISPINGIGPSDLNIDNLSIRINKNKYDEIIIATSPNLEGEATALFIKDIIYNLYPKMNISRIARGVPTGAELDYTDNNTLQKSLEQRITI
jgi:recombination protein RecR